MEKQVKIMFAAAPNAIPVEAVLTMEAPEDLPDGTVGYMLVKTADGVEWAAIPVELPTEGTTGHVLTKTEDGVDWVAIPAVEHPIPALPETDGEYKLVITEGVATWVFLT